MSFSNGTDLLQKRRQCQQHGGRVARSAAQTSAEGDALGQSESQLARRTHRLHDAICRAKNQIVREYSSWTLVLSGPPALVFDLNRVGQRNGLKDGAELVEAVRALVQNPQIEIDLGQRTEPHLP